MNEKNQKKELKTNPIVQKILVFSSVLLISLQYVAAMTLVEAGDKIWDLLVDYMLGIAMVIAGIFVARYAADSEDQTPRIFGLIVAVLIMFAGAMSLPGDVGNNVQKLIGVDGSWPIGG